MEFEPDVFLTHSSKKWVLAKSRLCTLPLWDQAMPF